MLFGCVCFPSLHVCVPPPPRTPSTSAPSRYYDVHGGSITIDGQDVREVTQAVGGVGVVGVKCVEL